jgi:hypothetical protein
VVEVKFEEDAETKGWICPMTNKALGPGSKAVYLVPCGHAFSGVAVKEVAEEKCLQCGEAYAAEDVIPILPTSEEDVRRLETRMQRLKERGLTHSLKKAAGSKKKRKNGDADADADAEENGKKSTTNGGKSSGIKNASTASLTAKVLEEQEERNKKRKLEKNENLNSLFSNRDQTKRLINNNDFMTRGFVIPGRDK